MKTLLLNMFITRGAPLVLEAAGKLVRHGATAGAAWLAAQGVQTGSDVDLVVAGAMALVSIGLSVARAVLPKLAAKL